MQLLVGILKVAKPKIDFNALAKYMGPGMFFQVSTPVNRIYRARLHPNMYSILSVCPRVINGIEYVTN
jgi:hypothetical protein